jgi:2-polyprenyl-6-methoxyphenol hydroxylase-like FAD-dependent oxidoreductase
MKRIQFEDAATPIPSERSPATRDWLRTSDDSQYDHLRERVSGRSVLTRFPSCQIPEHTARCVSTEIVHEPAKRRMPEPPETEQKSATTADQSASDGDPLSAKIPGDDVITEKDRQILVVGDTIAGLTATHLLRHAGYDPLLVATSSSVTHEVTYLWPPAVDVLNSIAASAPILDVASPLDGVAVRARDGQREYTALAGESSRTETPATLVRTRTLRRALRAALPAEQRRQERTIGDVARREGGLAVEFGDGIREWFDVVLVTDSTPASIRSGQRATPDCSPLTQYEITTDSTARAERTLDEVWLPNALLQRIPAVGDSGSLVRLTTPDPGLPDCLAGGLEGPSVTGIPEGLESELRETEPTTVRQARLPNTDALGTRWGTDGVGFCGPAAWPAAPASGFRGSFGIEDALAFVAALTRQTRADGDVVDRYAARRLHRLSEIRRQVRTTRTDHEYPPDSSIDSSLERLSVLRSVALGPFLDSRLTALQRDGFE